MGRKVSMSKATALDLIKRASWAFSWAFISTFIVLAPGILSAPNLAEAKALVVAVLTASIAAAFSALKTFILANK